jgi:hypothetical protein
MTRQDLKDIANMLYGFLLGVALSIEVILIVS